MPPTSASDRTSPLTALAIALFLGVYWISCVLLILYHCSTRCRHWLDVYLLGCGLSLTGAGYEPIDRDWVVVEREVEYPDFREEMINTERTSKKRRERRVRFVV